MSGLRVLQLIDGLNIGGAEVLLLDLVRHLLKNQYQVSVAYSTPGPMQEPLAELGITMTRLPRLATVDPTLLWRMIKLIRQEKPDIVHTHLFKSDFHGRLAARLCGVPIVISTTHNNDAWVQYLPLGYLYGLTGRAADRIIAVSDEVRDYQIRYTRLPAEKIITIDNGVDVTRFQNLKEAGLALRAELNLVASDPTVGIIGRLEFQKDHETFLQAAVQIINRIPNAKFLIVGDGSLRDELTLRAHALGLDSSVIFCGIRKDIPAVLAALDLLVFSSRWEGLPVTLLEGMAAGLPVVSTAVGGVPGVAIVDVTALLVPPEAPTALSAACVRVLQDKALAQKLGAAGYQRVTARYSLQAMLSRTTNLYQELWQAHVKT